jgi:hypothetical protein
MVLTNVNQENKVFWFFGLSKRTSFCSIEQKMPKIFRDMIPTSDENWKN